MSATASAADVDPVSYDWSGPYIGVQGGYNSGESDDVPWDSTGVRPLTENDGPADMKGFLGGIYAGYNHQYNSFVMGVEADVNLNNLKGDDEDRGGDTNGFEADWSGALRVRSGYAIDNTLLYAAGGWAILNGDGTIRDDPGTPIIERHKTSFNGWTLGAGVEHAFSQNLVARVEYRYTDYSLEVEAYSGYDLGFEPKIHTVSVGLAYKF